MKNKIIRFFPASDMRMSHNGLHKVALEHKINTNALEPGEFLVFANAKLNRIKVYTAGNVIAYMKSQDGKAIDLNVIRYLPKYFNGTTFNFEGAVAETILAEIGKKKAA